MWTTNGVFFHQDLLPKLVIRTIGGQYVDVTTLKGITFEMSPKPTAYYDGTDPHGITMNSAGTLFNSWVRKAGKITYVVSATGDEDENNLFGTVSTEITFASKYIPVIPNSIAGEADVSGRYINNAINVNTGADVFGGNSDFHAAGLLNLNPEPNDIRYEAFGRNATKTSGVLYVGGSYVAVGDTDGGGGIGIYMSREIFVDGLFDLAISNMIVHTGHGSIAVGFQFAAVGGGHAYLQDRNGTVLRANNDPGGPDTGFTAAFNSLTDRVFTDVIIPDDKDIVFLIKGVGPNTSGIGGLMFIPK